MRLHWKLRTPVKSGKASLSSSHLGYDSRRFNYLVDWIVHDKTRIEIRIRFIVDSKLNSTHTHVIHQPATVAVNTLHHSPDKRPRHGDLCFDERLHDATDDLILGPGHLLGQLAGVFLLNLLSAQIEDLSSATTLHLCSDKWCYYKVLKCAF